MWTKLITKQKINTRLSTTGVKKLPQMYTTSHAKGLFWAELNAWNLKHPMEILLMNFIMNPHRIQIHMYIQLNWSPGKTHSSSCLENKRVETNTVVSRSYRLLFHTTIGGDCGGGVGGRVCFECGCLFSWGRHWDGLTSDHHLLGVAVFIYPCLCRIRVCRCHLILHHVLQEKMNK